jgi:hypothetical protein
MNEEGEIARSLTGEAAVKTIEKTEETVIRILAANYS